jgi:D-arginine dehydrogenase
MENTDILIVGGGIAGASLGARLVPHRRVILIEAEDLCGRHATGRSAAFWQASLGGDTPERRLSLASKPMFDARWPGAPVPLLRQRGAQQIGDEHLVHAVTPRRHGLSNRNHRRAWSKRTS